MEKERNLLPDFLRLKIEIGKQRSIGEDFLNRKQHRVNRTTGNSSFHLDSHPRKTVPTHPNSSFHLNESINKFAMINTSVNESIKKPKKMNKSSLSTGNRSKSRGTWEVGWKKKVGGGGGGRKEEKVLKEEPKKEVWIEDRKREKGGRKDEGKRDEIRKEEGRKEESRREELKKEEGRREEGKRDEGKREEDRKEEAEGDKIRKGKRHLKLDFEKIFGKQGKK